LNERRLTTSEGRINLSFIQVPHPGDLQCAPQADFWTSDSKAGRHLRLEMPRWPSFFQFLSTQTQVNRKEFERGVDCVSESIKPLFVVLRQTRKGGAQMRRALLLTILVAGIALASRCAAVSGGGEHATGEQQAVDAVFTSDLLVGISDLEKFPRSPGRNVTTVTMGGPVATQVPATFETAVVRVDGGYRVTLTMHWQIGAIAQRPFAATYDVFEGGNRVVEVSREGDSPFIRK
jgi:hypothetical protein